MSAFECRELCAACCEAISISSPIPGMPGGKPAGVRCVNLDPRTLRCRIWGTPEYPEVCRRFRPDPAVCGSSREEAMRLLTDLERLTAPEQKPST